MTTRIVARWNDWAGTGIEHLVLREAADEVVADAVILGSVEDELFAARYRIGCDGGWRVRKVAMALICSDHPI
jgi:hypothetical protein